MKRTRVMMLAAVMIGALVGAVLPALAGPFDAYPNWSFEYDDDGNGIPDEWIMRGDGALYLCGHPSPLMLDDCLVGFLADDQRALIFQRLDPGISPDTGEAGAEGLPVCLFEMVAAAQQLDEGRVYGGVVYQYDGSDNLKLYSAIPGGKYKFSEMAVIDTVGSETGIAPPDRMAWGWLALPGDGGLFIDRADAAAACWFPGSVNPYDVSAIIGLGSCAGAGYPNETCGPAGTDSVDVVISSAQIEGGLHSNCNCDINASNDPVSNLIEGGLTCVGSLEGDSSKFTVDPPAQEGVAWKPDPLEDFYRMEYYEPGGYYASLAQADTCGDASTDIDANQNATHSGGCYHYFTSDQTSNNGSAVWEGIYFFEGDFTTIQSVVTGAKGATFITRDGVIDIRRFPQAGGAMPYQNSGYLLAYSDKGSPAVPYCNNTINLGSSSPNGFHGVVYAPYGVCHMPIATTEVLHGAIVCNYVDISASNFAYSYDPNLLFGVP